MSVKRESISSRKRDMKTAAPQRPHEEVPSPPDPRGKEFGGDNGTHYTPWLVLRYASGDTGVRPLLPGTLFWASPDVWVESSSGYNIPVAGQDNTVYARVNNLGLQDATGVVVKWWWANPSLAITEVNAHQIGMASAFVGAGSSVVVECPTKWVPVVENQGHECLLAEAFVPISHPMTAPLDVWTDRHNCQKNLHVIEVAAGKSFSFQVNVRNPVGHGRQVQVAIRPMGFDEIMPRLRQLAKRDRPPQLVETRQKLALKVEMPHTGTVLAEPSTVYARRLLAMAQTAMTMAGPTQDYVAANVAIHAADFGPWETLVMALHGEIPSHAKPGQVFAFDLSQRIEDVVTGGYRLYVVVAGKR